MGLDFALPSVICLPSARERGGETVDDLEELFVLNEGRPLPRDLLAKGERLRWAKGEHVPTRGGVYYVETGLIIVRRILLEGQSKALFVARDGHFFHDVAYAQQKQGLTEVSSLCTSVGYYFSPDMTDELLAGCAEFRRVFLYSLACKARSMGTDLVFFACLTGARRLLFIMENIADRMGGKRSDGTREVHVSQNELAEYLGLHRGSVNRLLKELESEGLIRREQGRIVLSGRGGGTGEA